MDSSGNNNRDSAEDSSEDTGLMTRKQLYNPFDSDEEEGGAGGRGGDKRYDAEPPVVKQSKSFPSTAAVPVGGRQRTSPSSSLSTSPTSTSSTHSLGKHYVNIHSIGDLPPVVHHHQRGGTCNSGPPPSNKTVSHSDSSVIKKDGHRQKSGSKSKGEVRVSRGGESPSRHSPPKPVEYKYDTHDIWVKQSSSSSGGINTAKVRPNSINNNRSVFIKPSVFKVKMCELMPVASIVVT